MASKTYTSSVFSRTARPRSERLRKLGVAAGSASGSISSSEGSITMNLWGTQVTNGATINTPIDIRDNELDYINIGGIRLTHDSTNNALKVSTPNGGTANLYATGGVSAYGIGSSGGNTPDTGVDEVYVGSTEPTDEETELWVNPSVSDEDKFGATINSSGHLVLTVPDVEATIKAKYNGSWLDTIGGVSGSGSGSTTIKGNEIEVSATQPTDSDVELWAKVETGVTQAPFGATINSDGDLVLSVDDVQATLKAKYGNEWINVGGAVSSGSGSNVSVSTLLSSGTQIATIVVNGTSHALYAPVGGNGGVSLGETSDTAYRGDRGKSAYEHSLLTSGNPHGVKYSDLSDKLTKSDIVSLVGLKSLAYMDESDISSFVNKSGDSIAYLEIGSGTDKVKLSYENGALKIDGNVYASGGISAYGVGEGSEVVSGVTSIDGNTGAVTLKTINGQSLVGSGNIVVQGGGSYSQGDYISINGSNAISVNLTSLKTALDYDKIVTTDNIDDAITDCSATSIESALGYTPAKSNELHSHSNKSYLDELTSDSVLKTKVGIDDYVKKIGDTMTGKLIITGKDSTTIGSKSVDYSLWLKDNQLMEFGKYLSWYGADVTDVDGADMPWYGIGAYADNDGNHKTHIAGYYGVCLHTNGNEYVRLYGGTGSGKLRIGNGVLCWDSAKSAFYMYNAEDGSNCNLYATGGISAYGMLSSTPLDNLTVTNTLKAKNVNAEKLSLRYGSGDDEGQCDVTASENGWQFVELAEFVAGIKTASIEDVVTKTLKVGTGGSIIKKIVVDSSIKSGDSNACVAISIGSNVYYVNAVKV